MWGENFMILFSEIQFEIMSGILPRMRRRSNSGGMEDKVEEAKELGWKSVWQEARMIARERKRVMEEQGQTKWVFRAGQGNLPDVVAQQKEGWLAIIADSKKLWEVQDKEERRLEGMLASVRAGKGEVETRIREAEEQLVKVEELVRKVEPEQGGAWSVEVDRPCSCLAECGCLVEVKLVLGEEERREVVLHPADWVVSKVEKEDHEREEEEEKTEVLRVIEREEEEKSEVRKVEETRTEVIRAQVEMMEKDELIRRCVSAGHWERVDELVNGLRRAWTVLSANEGEGGWPDKWWAMVSSATLARGEAFVVLRKWEKLLAVVGKLGEGSGKIPKQGEMGWTTEKRAKWFLLRARSRHHHRQYTAARYDLATVTNMAGQWPGRQWAKVRYTLNPVGST